MSILEYPRISYQGKKPYYYPIRAFETLSHYTASLAWVGGSLGNPNDLFLDNR